MFNEDIVPDRTTGNEFLEKIYNDACNKLPIAEGVVYQMCELGFSQRKIAKELQISHWKVRSLIASAQKKLKENIDSHVLSIFAKESNRHKPKGINPNREPVPAGVARAREYLEELGWLTSMPTGRQYEIYVKPPNGTTQVVGMSKVCLLARKNGYSEA